MSKIKCPYCGAEYLPGEIYIPEDFFAEFEDLVKDDEGKIVATYERPINLHEEYICDYCNHCFAVDAAVTFTTSMAVNHDFGTDYSTPLYTGDRLELSEN